VIFNTGTKNYLDAGLLDIFTPDANQMVWLKDKLKG